MSISFIDFWHSKLSQLFRRSGAEFSVKVKSVSPKAFPLKQGGLEIITQMVEKWENERAMEILRSHVKKDAQYSDKKEILGEFFDTHNKSEERNIEAD